MPYAANALHKRLWRKSESDQYLASLAFRECLYIEKIGRCRYLEAAYLTCL